MQKFIMNNLKQRRNLIVLISNVLHVISNGVVIGVIRHLAIKHLQTRIAFGVTLS